MGAAIVTTTIYVPELLDAYAADAAAGGSGCEIIVVGDRKTPPEASAFCRRVGDTHGVAVTFLDVAAQEAYLARFPELAAHLPWNSIQRRNVGMLLAYERGYDPIVTIDDDNFLVESGYLSAHGLTGTQATLPVLSSSTGWLNICEQLTEARGVPFYPRGFPLLQRWRPSQIESGVRSGKVVVNAGLWVGDPDVDAVQRLAYPVESTAYTAPGQLALARGTWCPFNSQNTALARDVLPAYFLSPSIGRYDDIWAAYVVLRIADHLDHLIAFGHPIVRQDRNPHDYLRDLDKERVAMGITDRFCEALRAIELTAAEYGACLDEVVGELPKALELTLNFDAEAAAFLDRFILDLAAWRATFRRLGG